MTVRGWTPLSGVIWCRRLIFTFRTFLRDGWY